MHARPSNGSSQLSFSKDFGLLLGLAVGETRASPGKGDD